MKALLCLFLLAIPLAAEDAIFIDIKKSDNLTELRTGDTLYVRNHQSVTLIGAIHIGDKAYYQGLNESFRNYDVILFEMVGGDVLQGRQPLKAAGGPDADPSFKAITNLYTGYAKSLQLSSQTIEIDYTAGNFVHADMSLAAYNKLTREKDESVFGFALQNSVKLADHDMSGYLNALLTGNSNGQKREVAKTLLLMGGEDPKSPQSVIVHDRNAVCFERLEEQLEIGMQKIGIFYGAAHFPDMHKRLVRLGFKPVKHTWRTAWRIPGPPLPEPAK